MIKRQEYPKEIQKEITTLFEDAKVFVLKAGGLVLTDLFLKYYYDYLNNPREANKNDSEKIEDAQVIFLRHFFIVRPKSIVDLSSYYMEIGIITLFGTKIETHFGNSNEFKKLKERANG